MGKTPKFIELAHRLFYLLYPFSIPRLIAREIGKSSSVCDLGCGDGTTMSYIKDVKRGFSKVTGCEIYYPYLQKAKERKVYDYLIQADIRRLPFQDKKFDVSILLSSIEHLEKDRYFEAMERISNKVIIITPNGFTENPEEKGVIYQHHLSGYTTQEFRKRNYAVYGIGWAFIAQKFTRIGRVNPLIRPVFTLVNLLLTVFTYYMPMFADQLLCVKENKG